MNFTASLWVFVITQPLSDQLACQWASKPTKRVLNVYLNDKKGKIAWCRSIWISTIWISEAYLANTILNPSPSPLRYAASPCFLCPPRSKLVTGYGNAWLTEASATHKMCSGKHGYRVGYHRHAVPRSTTSKCELKTAVLASLGLKNMALLCSAPGSFKIVTVYKSATSYGMCIWTEGHFRDRTGQTYIMCTCCSDTNENSFIYCRSTSSLFVIPNGAMLTVK